jgi:hypothetical protein
MTCGGLKNSENEKNSKYKIFSIFGKPHSSTTTTIPAVRMRPRWLYFWLFAWLASQGRFTSLFLEDLGLNETHIGLLLSM